MNELILLVVLLVSALTGFAQSADQDTLTVTVENAHSDKGRVWCALYSSASGFPKSGDAAKMRVSSPLLHGTAACQFSGLSPGRYAVSIFHDENGNGKLDSNFLGIPKEGVGASNDASSQFGPPKFDKAAFDYRGGKFEIVVHLRYL